MKHIAHLAVCLALLAPAAHAEEEADPNGRSLMEQGMELFFEGLREEMSPALKDLQSWSEEFGPQMRSFFKEMGPAFGEILNEVKDWSRYEAPEFLPNGDIIIRRKPEEEPRPETDPEPEAPAGPTDI